MTLLPIAIIALGLSHTPAAWHTDYARACADVHAGDKPLFIVICSSESEYRQMAALGAFFSDALESTLRAHYVRLFIESDSVAGKELGQRFEANGTPHFVILDRTARWQVYYKSGYLMETDLAPVLEQFKRAKLTANGTPIRSVTRQPIARVCST